MKKIAIFKIVMFSVISILLIGILVYGLIGKHGIFNFGWNHFHYANASTYEIAKEEVILSNHDINEIEINWLGGNVEVKYTEKDEISFKENFKDKNENSDYLMRYLSKNNKLTIQFCNSKWFVKKSIRDSKSLYIYLPIKFYHNIKISSTLADINYQATKDSSCTSLDVDSVSGNIFLQNLSITNLKINNVSGGINLSNIDCGQEIEIDTVSGAINLTDVKASSLDLDCVSSRINILGIIDNINVDGVSNNVTLTMYEAPKRLDSESVSGSFKLIIPENDGFIATLDSVSGNINSNFEVNYNKKQIIYKNASLIYKFDTVSGDVSINKLDSTLNN